MNRDTDAAVPAITLAVGGRQAAKRQTRQRVREAARALFAARGLADTTAQQIATAARVAVGTLFQHASDKEDLLLLVLHDPLAEAIRTAVAQPPSDDVLTDATVLFGSVLKVYAAMERAARASVRAQWFGVGPNARAVQWQYETFVKQVVARLERAQDAGALAAGADARRLASNLSALYQGVLLDWLWTDEPMERAIVRLREAFALQLIPLQTTAPGDTA
jgi:AcrR family transcriptional regulator